MQSLIVAARHTCWDITASLEIYGVVCAGRAVWTCEEIQFYQDSMSAPTALTGQYVHCSYVESEALTSTIGTPTLRNQRVTFQPPSRRTSGRIEIERQIRMSTRSDIQI